MHWIVHRLFLRRRSGSAALAAILAAAACESPGGRDGVSGNGELRVDTLPSPAALGSAEPNLAVDAGGRVHLTWIERRADASHALRMSVLEGERWSPPRTIAAGRPFFVNWADFPSLTIATSGRLVAHWLERNGTEKYAYGVRVSQSTDGGATWSAPIVPHRDGSPTEHGFVSLYPAAGDSVGLVWLDGRKMSMPDSVKEMTLRATVLAADGGLAAESLLDARICDCCQTAVAKTAHGPVAVYRDRSPGEIRDISIVRLVDGRWNEPRSVYADGWHIEACPVNGPAIAARGDTVAVAWFTGARDTARVHVAFSEDGGTTFGAPLRVDDGAPAGRVDVELDAGGRALVSWIERAGGDRAEVRARFVAPGKTTVRSFTIASSSAARSSGFPRMVHTGESVVFAWTQPGDSSIVRVARARLAPSAP